MYNNLYLVTAFLAGLFVSGLAIIWGLSLFLKVTGIGICWWNGRLRVIAKEQIKEY